ncbi:hypothetical protein EYZ11_000413 [Aspergillus tanneri]|uniref:FAD/NAD(P)-binding domain-containing protein n=1 Tax=Aspergillus tanneri TaxID=1220188 RepID=A0A4S3JXB4_9EURO|nr:uncharacterized protein ATNIH1004_006815 [Aspergillus tanneri]KAA8645396.1 hypothetical protein ATNIH1004_006815 [Aspergillus tanneri]THD00088.1 hypothetical protein EYZ11_000413 [Aspergillus tanneri]
MTSESYDVLIIGAGFSGLYALYKFRTAGLRVRIFEAGDDIGGVWHWNRYPGARVDSEWPLYQLSVPDVWRDFNFSQRFPDHNEIRRYFAHVDRVLELKKDIQFQARVHSATWDDDTAIWTIRSESGHIAVARHLCLFTGLLHRAHKPDFPGLDIYQGQIIHSSAWPDSLDLSGKKVAVIGTGATGVQIIQELSKQVNQLTVFLRRPSTCFPMGNRPLTTAENDAWRPYFHVMHSAARNSHGGFPSVPPTREINDITIEELEAFFEEIWQAGGFNFFSRNFPSAFVDRDANRIVYDFWARKVRERIQDPVKRDLMAPLEPVYPILTRRTPLEQDFYESIDRKNVEVVGLRSTPISTFTEKGVRTDDGMLREFDYLVMATGFDSFTGSISEMNIQGRNGANLNQIWKEGVRTYLGMTVHGFPNCFLSYSPHAPTPLSNGPTILQCQVDFIVDAITKMEKDNLRSIEPTVEAETQWRETILNAAEKTLFLETDSWWIAANIPGKKKEMLTYLGGINQYEKECRETLDKWTGFVVREEKIKSNSKPEEGNGVSGESKDGEGVEGGMKNVKRRNRSSLSGLAAFLKEKLTVGH